MYPKDSHTNKGTHVKSKSAQLSSKAYAGLTSDTVIDDASKDATKAGDTPLDASNPQVGKGRGTGRGPGGIRGG